MKIAFYILTFIVCGVAAYFSLSHKEMFEKQVETRIETIQTNRNVSARADVEESKLATLIVQLDAAKLERDTADAALVSVQSTGRNLTGQLSEIQSSIDSQLGELTKLNEDIAKVTAVLAEFGENVTPDTVTQIIEENQKRRDELIMQRDELDELIAAGERNLAEKRAESERIAQRTAARNAQLALNATEAVISAVNHDWGFVLIGAGSNSGFSPQSSMVVQRDGRVIGRVRPSSIEPTQTVAEIEYSTMAPGVRFQPGDRVLLARPIAN